MNYPRLNNEEFARGLSVSDPAVPFALDGQYTNGIIRVLPGSQARLQVDAATVTGAGASLTFTVEESTDQSTWTTAGSAVVTAAGTTKATITFTKPWARVRITAKAGTTPAATGVSVNLLLGSP